MGWSAGEEKEIYSLDELIEKFSLAGVHRSSAIFNYEPNNPKRWTDDKLIWMNAEYIRTMPLAELLPMVKAELKSAKLWREEYDEDGEVLLKQRSHRPNRRPSRPSPASPIIRRRSPSICPSLARAIGTSRPSTSSAHDFLRSRISRPGPGIL